MKYHPHGDASIADALVQLGQKELLIDCQGNWGKYLDRRRGGGAALHRGAADEIRAGSGLQPEDHRVEPSYDGRNKEPVTLPMKFPLLLAQGVEGIAVGLACKILPHNFHELIDGAIAGPAEASSSNLVPDFLTGGMMDATDSTATACAAARCACGPGSQGRRKR